jgi:hypothetical protein
MFQRLMGIAGYVSVFVQLYCVGSHCFNTCFGLHSHLQVCRIFYFILLEGFCFAAFFFYLFFTCLHSACFHLFLCCFPSLFLLIPCLCACLLALSLLLQRSSIHYILLGNRYILQHVEILRLKIDLLCDPLQQRNFCCEYCGLASNTGPASTHIPTTSQFTSCCY